MEIHGRLAGGLLGTGSCLRHALAEVVEAVEGTFDGLLDALDPPLDVGLAFGGLVDADLPGVLLALYTLPETVVAEEHALDEDAQPLRATTLLWRRWVLKSS